MKFIISICITAILFLSACTSKFGKILKSTDNEYKYRMAEQFYAKKEYSKAQELYSQLMAYMRSSSRYEDMSYKFAYTSYYMKDYENAELLFKTYTENFPSGVHLEEAYYMRGYCYYLRSPRVELDQTPTSKAKSLMLAFLSAYPNSERGKEAQEIIDKCNAKLEEKDYRSCKLYLHMEKYLAAITYYDMLMDNYPDSDHGDLYLYEYILSRLNYAKLSVPYRQLERFQKTNSSCKEFIQRFPNSKWLAEIQKIQTETNNSIKYIENEQTKTASKS